MPGSSLTLKDVGLNPSRTAFLDVLEMLGARVERRNLRSRHNEIVGDLYVEHSLLPGSPAHVLLRGEIIANLSTRYRYWRSRRRNTKARLK
jgi:3-phosphoshikimate 1-carboxyvinyltransferase